MPFGDSQQQESNVHAGAPAVSRLEYLWTCVCLVCGIDGQCHTTEMQEKEDVHAHKLEFLLGDQVGWVSQMKIFGDK